VKNIPTNLGDDLKILLIVGPKCGAYCKHAPLNIVAPHS
jgi:hypothetical protein